MAAIAIGGILCLLLCSLIIAADVAPGYHEMSETLRKRDTFVRMLRSNAADHHEVVIAIKQRNIDELQRQALDRSTPGNPLYQKWMSFQEVGELVTNLEAHDAVLAWLEEHGVSVLWVSRRKEYIRAGAPIHKWETVLQTKFFQHRDTSRETTTHLYHRCASYHLPSHLVQHVQTIFNTVQAPPVMSSKYSLDYLPVFSAAERRGDGLLRTYLRTEKADAPSTLKETSDQSESAGFDTTAAPNGAVTVEFLSDFYQIRTNIGSMSLNQSVFATLDEYFSPDDLSIFQQYYDLTVQPAISIGNHSIRNCSQPGVSCFEGNLDIQYIMGIAQQTSSIFWWVSSDSGDPFLAWITTVADESNPPLSNSISWGAIEQTVSASVLSQWEVEASKLAAMGVTITVASGDNGAPNATPSTGCLCNYDSSQASSSWPYESTWSGQGYFPSFPATSAWVTAVGGTQGPPSGQPEIACQSQQGGVITTGGGFSTYYPRPGYQNATVRDYLEHVHASQPPSGGYNPAGRAYPDISYLAVRYQVVVARGLASLYGTSCAAPVLAAMVSLLNSARRARRQSSIGFMNPTLYDAGASSSSAVFNDISAGHNRCCLYRGGASATDAAVCCAAGFAAVPGWDPVTGWGSANYTALARLFGLPDTPPSPSPSPSSSPSTPAMAVWAAVAGAVAVGVAVAVCWASGGTCRGRRESALPADLDKPAGRPPRPVKPPRPPRAMHRAVCKEEGVEDGDIELQGLADPAAPVRPRKPPRAGRGMDGDGRGEDRPAQAVRDTAGALDFQYDNPQARRPRPLPTPRDVPL